MRDQRCAQAASPPAGPGRGKRARFGKRRPGAARRAGRREMKYSRSGSLDSCCRPAETSPRAVLFGRQFGPKGRSFCRTAARPRVPAIRPDARRAAACLGRRLRETRRPRFSVPRGGPAGPRRCRPAAARASRAGEAAEGARGGRGRGAGRRRRDRGGRPRPGESCRSAALIRQAAAAAARRPAASRGGHSGPGRRRSRAARARRDSSRSATSGGSAARRTPATRRPRPGHPPPERTRGRSRKTARAGWRRT